MLQRLITPLQTDIHQSTHVARKGCHVTLDKLPAWVCEPCGEFYFKEDSTG